MKYFKLRIRKNSKKPNCAKLEQSSVLLSWAQIFNKKKDLLLNMRYAVIDMYEKWLPHPAQVTELRKNNIP